MLPSPRSLPSRVRVVGLAALVLTVLAAGVLLRPTSADAAAIDTGNRLAVAQAYQESWVPAMRVAAPTPAADVATTCRPDPTPADLQQATLDGVNFIRAMSGVSTVTLDAGLSAKAQQAALMGYATGALDRTPSSRTACWSTGGEQALGRSNLALGYAGADVVRGYADSAGSPDALDRWWLQRPSTTVMGAGTVGTSSALWVAGGRPSSTDRLYTSWPSAGYFPSPLEPAGLWSFTTWNPDYDLSGAAVTVDGPDGQVAVTVRASEAMDGSLTFRVPGVTAPTGDAVAAWTVTVTGISRWGQPVSPVRYTVRLFDPDVTLPPPLVATSRPVVSGVAQVGATLSATAPSWTVAGTTTGYQWVRGTTPIDGATSPTLQLGAAEVGQVVTVRATGTAPGRDPVTVASDPTAVVVKRTSTLAVRASSPLPNTVRLEAVAGAVDESGLTGTLTVSEGSRTLGTLDVVDGAATLTLDGVTAGRHTYTAAFSGTDRVQSATQSVAVAVVDRSRPTVSVEGSSPAVGRADLVVRVSGGGSDPGGTVEVSENGRVLAAAAPVSGGVARWSGSGLSSGSHRYTLTYNGTALLQPASGAVIVSVRAKTTPTLKLSATSPSSGRVSLTVAVSVGSRPAVGSVTITEGGSTRRSGLVLKDGRATWTASGVKAGSHLYTVTYDGDRETAARSGSVKVTVKK